MNAKTIMMALAATAATAAIADVVEVKFTVKTENDGKVAKKVISGVCDTTADKHVFWTTETQTNEKGRKVKVNVPYQGTYFGLVNDTTVSRKVGQNAELIWGSESDPENVLVAGAWGTASSKSGQAAGILAGKPATGTWSAKRNTKKTYDELLAKYGVAQSTNKDKSVITGKDAEIEEALKTIAEANATIAAKDATIAAKDATITEKDATIADKDATITEKDATITEKDATIADKDATITEKDATIADKDATIASKDADLEKANADLATATATIEQYKADLAKADEDLAAKAAELATATNDLQTIEDAINSLDDEELPNMISEYLDETETKAQAMVDAANVRITDVETKFTAYTNSLDVAALDQDITDAQTNLNDKIAAVVEAQARVDALQLTNDMIAVIDAKQLETTYAGKASDIDSQIAAKQALIESAQANFVSYTNNLQTAIADAEKWVEFWATREATDWENYVAASNAQAEAQAAVDGFDPKSVEVMTYDEFIAEKTASGTTYADDVEARKDYDTYVGQEQQAAKGVLESALAEKKLDTSTKYATWFYRSSRLKAEQKKLEDNQALMDEAIKTGDVPEGTIAELEADIKELQAQKAALAEELAFWQAFSYSDDDRAKFAADLEAAKAALVTAQGEQTDAQIAYDEARRNKESQIASQSTKLQTLALAMGLDATGLDDIAGDVDAIREKVDEYRTTPLAAPYDGMSLNEMVENGEKMIESVKRIRAALNLAGDGDAEEKGL